MKSPALHGRQTPNISPDACTTARHSGLAISCNWTNHQPLGIRSIQGQKESFKEAGDEKEGHYSVNMRQKHTLTGEVSTLHNLEWIIKASLATTLDDAWTAVKTQQLEHDDDFFKTEARSTPHKENCKSVGLE